MQSIKLSFAQARLVTGQDVWGGKVVRKVRLVEVALVLVDWLDGQCGKVGQVVGMLASSSQYDISNTGYNGDCILRYYECHYAGEKMI